MALDVPASSSNADGRLEEAPEESVAEESPIATGASGIEGRVPRGTTTRIVTPTIGVRKRLRELWLSRELIAFLVRTEIKVKYKNSVLGILWSMLAPAMSLAIYWFVFSIVLKNGIPNFVIFLFAGLLVWNLFQFGVLTGTGTVVANGGIVKKVSFPREILALASVGSACVFFFFQAIVLVIFLIVLHTVPDFTYLPALLLALIAGIVLASAIGVLLSAVNVYLRDTQHLIEVILTAWFWACPIVYSFQLQIETRLGPRGLTWIYFLNPVVPLVLSFQRCLYAHTVVSVHGTATAVLPPNGLVWYLGLDLGVLVLSAIFFLVALAVFSRLEGNFAEEL